MRNYGDEHDGAGWQFSPVTAGLHCYTAHRIWVETGQSEAARLVRQQADALIRRGKRAGEGTVWKYNFTNRAFGAGPGWISGMGQGFGIACLAAAYTVTGDDRYLSAARRAFVSMRAPFGDRGTAVRVGRGVFYEEVAGAGARPAHILNGMIFALGGVWMLNAVDPHPEYERALLDGIAGVRAILDSYTAPGVSLYDLRTRRPAPIGKYNVIHVELLQWLYSLTGDSHFLEVALRFMTFERRLRPSFVVSGKPTIGTYGSFRGRRGDVVTLEASFARPTPLDRIEVISPSETTAPAEAIVDIGGRSVRAHPKGRYITLDVPLQSTRTVRIRFTPRRGSRVAMRLVTLSNPALRSFVVLSSDTAAYRDTRTGSRTPLNLTDGRTSSRWSSLRPDPWILVSLGEARAGRIRLATCPGTYSFAWSFAHDLHSFTEGGRTRASPSTTVTLSPPEGTRYVLVEWRGAGGCLAEISQA